MGEKLMCVVIIKFGRLNIALKIILKAKMGVRTIAGKVPLNENLTLSNCDENSPLFLSSFEKT